MASPLWAQREGSLLGWDGGRLARRYDKEAAVGGRDSQTMMSTLEVSGQRLLGNVRAVERAIAEAVGYPVNGGGVPALLGVVKANGYGHGATVCAPLLAEAGVRWLGVTDAEEGRAVRQSLGEQAAEILMMSAPPGDVAGARESAEMAMRHGLTPVVWTAGQLGPIAAANRGEPWPVHVEIDTGMSRQGVGWGTALEDFLDALASERRVRLGGVLTHLASAESAGAEQTTRQMDLFEQAVRRTAAKGLRPDWVHIGNASTIDNGSPAAAPILARLHRLAGSVGARSMLRCGLGLYGLCLPLEAQAGRDASGMARLRPLLQPVLTWRTSVAAVEEIAAGASVGYGAAFTARQPMRLALLPVGYADGLRRGLSGTDERHGGWVMIRGERAAIVGRVSMNLTTVDVTGLSPQVQVGEAVVLLGEGVTAEDHARLTGALPYEILCGLRGRPTRG